MSSSHKSRPATYAVWSLTLSSRLYNPTVILGWIGLDVGEGAKIGSMLRDKTRKV
jgi:hypothetical protein